MSIPQTPSPLSNILAAKTYNAAWFSGSTKETQITTAIAAAALDGALYVYIPANMLPYNATNVTFNTSVHMIREGGDPTVYDIKAYGATGSGLDINNDYTAIIAAFAGCPILGTVSFPTPATYMTSQEIVLTKSVYIQSNGAILKAITGSVINKLMSATDVDNISITGITFDANLIAKNGFIGTATNRSPTRLTFDLCTVQNTPYDNTGTLAGIGVNATGGAAGVNRYQNVKLTRCRANNCGTHGALLAYADWCDILDWKADNMSLHGFEFVGCTEVAGNILKAFTCGGSGVAIGDHSKYFVLSDIRCDNCAGDAAIVIENTCAYGKLTGFVVSNASMPGVSVSWGVAGVAPNDVVRQIAISNGVLRAMLPKAITGVTKANPAVVTCVGHTFKTIGNTQRVAFTGVVGMTQLNGNTYYITPIDADHFSLQTSLGVNLDSTGFGVYASGGTINIQCMGINAYGAIPQYAQNVTLENIDIDGFNSGFNMASIQGAKAKNIRVTNLQGPSSYVAQCTVVQFSQFEDIYCYDSTASHANGPFQFINNGATACDEVQISALGCRVCNTGSVYTPLIYTEGSGQFWMDHCRTSGALNYLTCRGGDTPTVSLEGFQGALTTSTPVVGTPNLIQSLGNYTGATDFVIIQTKKQFALPAIPTTGTHVVGEYCKNTIPAIGSPKGWYCTVGGTPGTWVSEGNL